MRYAVKQKKDTTYQVYDTKTRRFVPDTKDADLSLVNLWCDDLNYEELANDSPFS